MLVSDWRIAEVKCGSGRGVERIAIGKAGWRRIASLYDAYKAMVTTTIRLRFDRRSTAIRLQFDPARTTRRPTLRP